MKDGFGVREYPGGDLGGPTEVLQGEVGPPPRRVLLGELCGDLVDVSGVEEFESLSQASVKKPASGGLTDAYAASRSRSWQKS